MAILKVQVNYDVTRGTTLVLGMVHGGFWGVWHFLPLWKSCMAPDLFQNTTYWSNRLMFTRLASLAHFCLIGFLLGLPNSHFMSKTSPFSRDSDCPKISLMAPEKAIRWPKMSRFGTKCELMHHVSAFWTLYTEFWDFLGYQKDFI